jgi:hypothetical protein
MHGLRPGVGMNPAGAGEKSKKLESSRATEVRQIQKSIVLWN